MREILEKQPIIPLPKSFVGKNVNERGFSLFELMIVLLLLAIIAGVSAPATGKFLDNLAFRKKTAVITAVLRYARVQAVSKGQEVVVTLADEEPPSILVSGAETEAREIEMDEGDVIRFSPPQIAFLPEGQATPALLTYESGRRVKRIKVDPLTGMPVAE